jgi:tRNA (Thr-GGU) A37 N-methylase
MSVVRLIRISGNRMEIENVDILDGTPLLDIKPSVPRFDHHRVERLGWLEASQAAVRNTRSDKRFG